MGYGSRIKNALLDLDDRYADAIFNYAQNPKSPQWIASNIPIDSTESIRNLQGYAANGFDSLRDRIDYGRALLGSVGTRYLVPVTAAGLSLDALARAISSGEDMY